MHGGVRYIDRGLSHPPSVVAPHRLLRDKILPLNRIEEEKSGFVHNPLLAGTARKCDETEDAFHTRANAIKGARFAVLLPVEISGTVNEYMLNFQVDGVDFVESRGCPAPLFVPDHESLRRGAG
jgi:hypothetical protein